MSKTYRDQRNHYAHQSRRDRRVIRQAKHTGGVPLTKEVIAAFRLLQEPQKPTKSTRLPAGFDDQTLAITR